MTGVDQLFLNFVTDIYSAVLNFVAVVCFIGGIYFVVRGLHDLYQRSMSNADPQQSAIGSVLGILFAGLLLSFASVVEALTSSLFGSASDTYVFATANLAAGTPAAAAQTVNAGLVAFFRVLQLLGASAMANSLFILHAHTKGERQRTLSESIVLAVTGAVLFNGSTFAKALDATLNTSLFSA